jgi:nucleoside-diphosphate-sugar epimerase
MRVLIVGASGFIGRNIAVEAARAGHEIIACGRDPARLRLMFPALTAVDCDLVRDTVDRWRRRLEGVDAVINAAGVFQGDGANSLEAVHVTGPRALFDACAELRVPKLIQISALGADAQATSPFHLTKRKADEYCLKLAEEHQLVGWTVVRPSIVIGRGGQSTTLFAALGSLPRPPRLAAGRWELQPLHVSDLAYGVCLLLEREDPAPRELDFAGPRAMTTDQLTHTLRRWLLLPPAGVFTVPEWFLRGASAVGGHFLFGALSKQSLEMLARGNTACVTPLKETLDWLPRPLSEAMAADPSTQADLWHARLYFFRPALRTGLALLWIVTAIVSAFVYPADKSLAMTMGLGLTEHQAALLLYGGATVDAALGAALLFNIRPAIAGGLQIAVMLLFTVLATMAVPHAWADPLGPLTKNLAVLLATLTMIALESRR